MARGTKNGHIYLRKQNIAVYKKNRTARNETTARANMDEQER